MSCARRDSYPPPVQQRLNQAGYAHRAALDELRLYDRPGYDRRSTPVDGGWTADAAVWTAPDPVWDQRPG